MHAHLFALQQLSLDQISGYPCRMPVQFPATWRDEWLVRSVASYGVLNPLLVHATGDHAFHIVDGHRRYLAAKNAGITSLLCFILPFLRPGDDDFIQSVIHASIQPRQNSLQALSVSE